VTPENIPVETDALVRRPQLCVVSTVVVAVSVPVVAIAMWYVVRRDLHMDPPCSQRGPWACLIDETMTFWISIFIGGFVLVLSFTIAFLSGWFPRLGFATSLTLTIAWILVATAMIIGIFQSAGQY